MDDEDIDLRILEALESVPERPLTDAERKRKERRKWGPGGRKAFRDGDRAAGQEAFIDLYNRLAGEYGTAVTDGMIGGSIPPSEFLAMESRLRDDLDLWCEATGESRSLFLREAERLGLECWLWETHDRHRQADRFKPNKSTEHDIPWPGAPAKWAPRRWFALRIWSQSKNPLQISVSRALNRERKEARAELATEVAAERFHRTKSGEWENTSTEPIAERNHPKPQGF
jgi:hypothetical protein